MIPSDAFLDTPGHRAKAEAVLLLSRFFPEGFSLKAEGPGLQRSVPIDLGRYCDGLTIAEAYNLSFGISAIATRLVRLYVGLHNRGDLKRPGFDLLKEVEALLDVLEQDFIEVPFNVGDMPAADAGQASPGIGGIGDGDGLREVDDHVIEPLNDPRLPGGDGVVAAVGHSDLGAPSTSEALDERPPGQPPPVQS